MPKLNPNILTDPMGGLDAQFGIPTCIFGLAQAALSLLPGSILGGLHSGVSDGMGMAQSLLASIYRTIFRDLGIVEYDSVTGKFAFISDNSIFGVDSYGTSVLGEIAGFLTAIGEGYANASEFVTQIEGCLTQYKDWLNGVENKSNILGPEQLSVTPAKLAIFSAQTAAVYDFLSKAEDFQAKIELIFQEREANPALIPVFVDEEEVVEPIFRLTFGPPKAKSGQFILSVDGLYYDSQTREYGTSGSPTGVPTITDLSALEFVPDESRWLLDHAPNLGGRGTSYSLDDLNRYVDTIFDLNVIDESKDLQVWYDSDHLIPFMISQKNKRINDIQDNLVDLKANGYTTDSAIYLNFEQQIVSESASFNSKINKRKKQIEAAAKTFDVFGFQSPYSPGNVPINDFSYLSSINLDISISQQKNIAFDHGEVSGVILPIVPKYVHASGSTATVSVTPLLVTPPGAGSIIDGEDLETEPSRLSLVTGITTSDLIAVYNFTDVNFQLPDSTVFNTLNCNAVGTENRAQTVTNNPPVLFQQGLGLPYLTGIPVRNKLDSFVDFTGETWSSHEFKISDTGNYIRLPDTTDYQNLLYNSRGATIDFWTYMPGLYEQEEGWWKHPFTLSSFGFALSSSEGKWCDGHYYRVLLGCENTGGENKNISASSLAIDNSSDSVKGMVMGFSRDPRMYYNGSAVTVGPNDFDPRYYFGGIVDSITPSGGHPYAAGASGVWTVSSLPTDGHRLPVAHTQTSGTFSVSSNGTMAYSVGTQASSGDGYNSSSNGFGYVLYTLSDASVSAGLIPGDVLYGGGDPGVSATQTSASLGLSYFATGDDATLNIGTPSTVFFIAPTRSYNTSAVGFTKAAGCDNDVGEILKFTVSDELMVNDVKLKDCVNKFVNISVVFDVGGDKLNFYINGNLLKTDTLSNIFGRDAGAAPQVPSFIVPNTESTSSFEYTSGTVDQYSDVHLFDNGPKNNTLFTPWIVGGGWSDGRDINLATSSGGFLDTGSGIMSSYNGYVGSLKMYGKALNKNEIVTNYNHQRKFFENMDL